MRLNLRDVRIAVYNIETFYSTWYSVIKLFDEYSAIASEAKYNAIHGKGFKILRSEKMLQILAVVLAQLKAGDTSENLLNEIRQTIYSLCRAKQNTKKVYNNVMNSI